MMIQLTDTLQYDESKSLDEQTDEVQIFISEKMKTESEKFTNSFCGRTESEIWNDKTFQITRSYNYLAPETAKNCFALKNTIITVKEV